MKNLYLLIALVLLLLGCSGGIKSDLSALPVVNTVSELKLEKATAIPLTDDKIFLVSGKVKSNLYILGKGLIELTDSNDESIMVLTKERHSVGGKLTLKLTKTEIFSINDEGFDYYIEM